MKSARAEQRRGKYSVDFCSPSAIRRIKMLIDEPTLIQQQTTVINRTQSKTEIQLL